MRRCLSLSLLLIAATCLPAVAGDDEGLTLDLIFSDEFRAASSTPERRWLSDGTALLHDGRLPEGERTLERLDPRTGARTAAVDARAALASLAEAMSGEDEEAPESLAWPDVVHPSGLLALYLLEDDVFLLDVPKASFRRLTRTEEEETCPSFSPDGARVAFVRESDLYVFDLEKGAEKALTDDGSETLLNGTLSWVYWEEIFGRVDTGYWWSPDSSAIAYLRSDESMVEESVFTDFEPATPRVIRQRYPKAGSANPEVRLGVVGVETGETVWVELPDPRPEYLVRVVWLPDSSRVSLQTLDRAQQNLVLWLVDPGQGTAARLLTDTSDTRIQLHDDLVFLGGGSRFLWTSERDGFNRLYLYRIDGSQEAVLSPAGMMLRGSGDVTPYLGAVRSVDEAAGWVYFIAQKGSPAARWLYRVRLDGSGLEGLAEAGTHQVDFDRSSTFYLDRFSDIATPAGLFLHRAGGEQVATVTPPPTDYLAPFDLVTPELGAVTTADGVSLPMHVARPRDFDSAKRYPVILYVYGGPSAPSVWDAWNRGAPTDNLLLEAGYVCVTFDNRSATARSKALEATSHRRLMNAFEVSDVLAGVEWLKEQPWVDGERIGVWGWSGGGTFTLQLMTHSDAFKAGIAVAAVTDFRYYDTVWTEALLGLPEDNPEAYDAAAPASFADRLSGRLLLVHGTYDDNVHPQNAWRFADELIKADIPFEMMIYPMQKHGIRDGRKHLYRTMLDFWKRNL